MLDKNEFLNRFSDKETALKVYNSLKLAIEYNIVGATDIFVTANIWKKLNNNFEDIKVSLFGFDRKQIVFHPKEYEAIKNYKILEIEVKNKFREYTHKDFLGSIMALNIKRELFGDIFVIENKAYVYVTDSMVNYLFNNLKEVGKNEVDIKIVDKEDFSYNFEEIQISIISNRLDNFVSELTNLSRNKATEYIENSLVFVDYEIVKEKSKILSENTIITIRKYGKYLVYKELEKSKKNKHRWIIKKYI